MTVSINNQTIVRKYSNPEFVFSFTLDEHFTLLEWNRIFQLIVKKLFHKNPKIGLKILDYPESEKLKNWITTNLSNLKKNDSFAEFIQLPRTNHFYFMEWEIVKNQKLPSIFKVKGYKISLAPVKVSFEEQLIKVYRILNRISDSYSEYASFDKLVPAILQEVYRIFEADRTYLLQPYSNDKGEFLKIFSNGTLGRNNKMNYRGFEIPLTPYMSKKIELLVNSTEPVLLGYNTKNPLPVELTEKYGNNSYLISIIRIWGAKPWIFGISIKQNHEFFSNEKIMLFKELSIRINDILSKFFINQQKVTNDENHRALIDAIPDILVRIQRNGKIKDFNNPYAKFDFLPKIDVEGRNIYDFLPKDVRIILKRAILYSLKSKELQKFEFKQLYADQYIFFETRVVCLSGNEVLLVIRNITEQVVIESELIKREKDYHMLVENLPNNIGRFNNKGEIIYLNQTVLKGFGYPKEFYINKRYIDFSSEINMKEHSRLHQELMNVFKTGVSQRTEIFRNFNNEIRYYDIFLIPEKDEKGNTISVLGVSEDITMKKIAQIEIERINRALRMLSKVNQALTEISDENELIKTVCDIIINTGGYILAWVGYAYYDDLKSIRVEAYAGDDDVYVKNANLSWDESNPYGNGPGGIVFRTQKPYVVQDIQNDPTIFPWRDAALKRSFKSIISLPLTFKETRFGVIGIYSCDPGRFEKKEVDLLQEMVENLAFGINALRIKNKGIKVAQKLADSENRLKKITSELVDYHYSYKIKGDNTIELLEYGYDLLLTGYTFEEFKDNSKLWQNIIHPEDKGKTDPIAKQIFNGQNPKPFEHRIICKDGTIKWIRNSMVVFRDENGKIVSVDGVIKDISLQKIAENELRNSEERFAQMFHTNPFAIALLDSEDFKIIDINQGFTRLTGYKRYDAIGCRLCDLGVFLENGDRENLMLEFNKKGKVENFEIRIKHISGEVFIGLITTIEIYFKKKKHYLSLVQDITNKKKAEFELRKLFRAIEQSPVSVIITNTEGEIEYVNPRFCIVTGYSFDEIKGKNPRILKSGDMPNESYKELWKSILSGEEWSGEFHNKKKSGELFWEKATISPVFDDNNQITNYIAVKEDITEKKETDRRLLNAVIKTEEEERNRFSQELHDGLGPILSTIKLYFQWLSETDHSEKRTKITETGLQNIDEAISTIREISYRLSPRVLINLGLVAAISHIIQRINNVQKFSFQLDYDDERRYSSQLEITIYRVISELINNTLKYSNGNKGYLHLSHDYEMKHLNIKYSENGQGYDINTAMSNKGLGIQNIFRRVESLNGFIKFTKESDLMVTIIDVPFA